MLVVAVPCLLGMKASLVGSDGRGVQGEAKLLSVAAAGGVYLRRGTSVATCTSPAHGGSALPSEQHAWLCHKVKDTY